MANLETTQTPTPAPVDTPSIITSLDTQTGPEAQPQSFGPNLNGLAQGLDSASQDLSQALYRSRFDKKEAQAAKNNVWTIQNYSALDKEFTPRQIDADTNRQLIDPTKFDAEFQSRLSDYVSKAPNPEAASALMARGSELGLNYYKQNLELNSRITTQNNNVTAQNAVADVVNNVRKGTMSPEDGIAATLSIGNATAPVTPGAPSIVSQAQSDIIQAGAANIAKTQGPGIAALAVRGGYGGTAIDPTHRELLATQLDNQQTISQTARVSVAQQNVNGLANKAAAGGMVSTQDALAASNELADATQAKPVDTKPPSLTDFVQDRVSEFQKLSTQVTGPHAEIALRAIQQIQSQNISKVVEQRLNVMSPDEQRLNVNQMAATFGPDDPMVQHAARIAGENIEMLTPGTETYDPAGVAMKNPAVQASLANAQAALQAAATPEDQGKAQGLLKTAIEQSFAAQRLVGVQKGQEQVLTRQQAETFANSTHAIGDDRELVQQKQQMYGPDYSSRAITQIFQSKGVVPGGTQMALLNPDSDKLWAAAEFQDAKLEKTDPVYGAITTALQNNQPWQNYWSSQRDDLSAAQRREQMGSALPKMAEYYMAQFKMNPKDAVDAVINDSIGHAYTTIPGGNGMSISFPSKIAPTTDDAAAITSKATLAMNALIQQHGITDTDGRGDAANLTTLAIKNGYWAYDFKTGLLTRMYDNAEGPKAVMLGNGQPLALDPAQLKNANVMNAPGDTAFIDQFGKIPVPFMRGFSFTKPSTPTQKLGSDPNLMLGKPTVIPSQAPILTAPAPAKTPPPTVAPQDTPQAQNDRYDWHQDIKITHYGYADDNTPDRNSKKGIGAFDNPLSPGAVAVSPSVEKKMNLMPGDVIEMYGSGGKVRYGYFADRTDQKLTDDRIDLYDPHGSEVKGAPFQALAYRKVGGGNPKLKGRLLTAAGEHNIATIEASNP